MIQAKHVAGFLCLVSLSGSWGSAQVITKSNSGLTTGETILLSNADQFQIPPYYSLSFVSAQDVDGDGKMDLLVGVPTVNNQAPVTTTLLRNTGSQNFQFTTVSTSSYCQPAYANPPTLDALPPFCTLLDVNGDGMADRIFAGGTPNSANPGEVDNPYVAVAYATGPGSFTTATKYLVGGSSQFVSSVATGDFNGDGRTDIAVLRIPQTPPPGTGLKIADIVLLIANPAGGFTVSAAVSSGVFQAGSLFFPKLAALDLNDDGKSDLIVFDGSGDSAAGVFFGAANGLTAKPEITQFIDTTFHIFVAADLNHDGYGDVVAEEIDGVHVLLGGPGGTIDGYFSKDTKLVPSDNYQQTIVSVVSADFNGDGYADLAVSTMNDVTIYQNNHGTFSRLQEYPASGLVAVGDFDGDGKLDLVAGGNPLTIIYGQGNGYFYGSPVTSSYGQPGTIVAGDFNGDGIQDVASTGIRDCTLQKGCSDFVSVFLGTGKGWFNPPVYYPVPFNNNVIGGEMQLMTADLNGDGKLDFVISGYNVGSLTDTAVLLGKGDGTFATAKSYTLGVAESGPSYLRDMDNDGKIDFVGAKGVAYGKGDGTFTAMSAYPIGPVNALVIGDFNRDGKLDILTNSSGEQITLLLGQAGRRFTAGTSMTLACRSGCADGVSLGVGDLNHDGKLDFAALGTGEVLTYLGNGSGGFTEAGDAALRAPYQYEPFSTVVSIADLNSDGKADVLLSPGMGLMPVLLGRGNGTLSTPINFPLTAGFGDRSAPPAIGYFNAGPSLDVIVPAGGGFARLLNTGASTWPTLTSLGQAPAP